MIEPENKLIDCACGERHVERCICGHEFHCLHCEAVHVEREDWPEDDDEDPEDGW